MGIFLATYITLFMSSIGELKLLLRKPLSIARGFPIRKYEVLCDSGKPAQILTLIAAFLKKREIDVIGPTDEKLFFSMPQKAGQSSIGFFWGEAKSDGDGGYLFSLRGSLYYFIILWVLPITLLAFTIIVMFYFAIGMVAAVRTGDVANIIGVYIGHLVLYSIELGVGFALYKIQWNRIKEFAKDIEKYMNSPEANEYISQMVVKGIKCPECGFRFSDVPSEWMGRKVRCEQCRNVFVLTGK